MTLKELLENKKRSMGQAPGLLLRSADTNINPAHIEVLDYNENTCYQSAINNPTDAKKYLDSQTTQSWINFINVNDTEKLKAIGEVFGIHTLVLEDISNTHQRPKFEDWDNYIHVVITMLNPKEEGIDQEQVSFILGQNYLISFQEKAGDVFDAVRTRLENSKGRVRKMTTDYLLYLLLDSIVDHYFLVLESIHSQIEKLEDSVEKYVSNKAIVKIQKIKRDILLIRRIIAPVRELCQELIKSESCLVLESNMIYFKDLQDHTVQTLESIDTLRDFTVSLLEYCNSYISTKLNEIMKVLTMVSTIFIPITFIAGIYGMNFVNMPELNLPWGYPAVIGLMLTIVTSMFIYFKRKKWL